MQSTNKQPNSNSDSEDESTVHPVNLSQAFKQHGDDVVLATVDDDESKIAAGEKINYNNAQAVAAAAVVSAAAAYGVPRKSLQ